MRHVFFDLDNTLIQGDSDYLWGEFLVEKKLVDKQEYQQNNRKFYEDYEQGILDYDAYLRFSLVPLARYPTEDLLSLNHDFVENVIRPLIYPESYQLIEQHNHNQDKLVVNSATNSFIVTPIAHLLGVSDVISTQLEVIGEQYTGKCIGLPNYGANKLENTYQWLQNNGLSKEHLQECVFYSDSFNDLPLLKQAGTPIAVNADDNLRDYALNCGWQIIDFPSIVS